ncbi:hypothetical protein K492DRAFT_195939 [Lichtheimia hyalospora FSU 10163]|nr:hypothetical protein K492DRAFT_195939 [Lichtheimia hyalospora FSU 10163]
MTGKVLAAYPLSPQLREMVPKLVAASSISANNTMYFYGGASNSRLIINQVQSLSFDQRTGDAIYQKNYHSAGPPVFFGQAILIPNKSASMYLFGGTSFNNTRNMTSTSMPTYKYVFENSTWQAIHPTIQLSNGTNVDATGALDGRAYFVPVISPINQLVYIFGGVDNVNFEDIRRDFWVFDPSYRTYTQLPYPGFTMYGYVTAALDDGSILYLGGMIHVDNTSLSLLNENTSGIDEYETPANLAVIYNTYSGAWNNITLDTTYSHGPNETLGAMAVLGPEKRYIYLLGGQDDTEGIMLKLNRLYVLDTKTWTWYEPNVQGSKPVGRMFGSAVLLNENYAVFAFGQETMGIYSNDIDILKLPSLGSDGNIDFSTMKWVQNIVTGDTHNASNVPSNSSALGGGIIAVIRMIYFSLWNPRDGEPSWLEACRLALKAVLMFLFIAFLVFLLVQVLHSPTATYTVSVPSPDGLITVPDIRFCFEGYPIVTNADDGQSFPYVGCNTDASTSCSDNVISLNTSVHKPVFVTGIQNTSCFLFQPGELRLASENRPGENNGTTLRFSLYSVGDASTISGRAHVSFYPPGRDPNAVIYLNDHTQQISDVELNKWIMDDYDSFQSETVIDLDPRDKSNVEYQLEEHLSLQDVGWNYVGFASVLNRTATIDVKPHTQPLDPSGWSPTRQLYIMNQVYVRPSTYTTVVYREQKIYTLVQALGLLGGVLGLLSISQKVMFGTRAQSPIGLIQRWSSGTARQSILKGIKSRFFASGETSTQTIPFVSPISHYSNRECEEDHKSPMALEKNKDAESELPMYSDNDDQRMATLEDRICLLERVFKSYYVDGEMFYLLNESIESPEMKQRGHSNNASCQETRFTRFFRRMSPARSSNRRKRWARVPNAGHHNDHLSTSSASPLENPEDNTSKSSSS